MNVLVGCEYSGIVRDAFDRRGHQAVSCDILPTESIGVHIQGDIVGAIELMEWDLIILHPPCTYLAVSGNRWYGKGTLGHSKRGEAIVWTMDLWNKARTHCEKVCLENPVNVLPIKATQFIQPWQFGHGEVKKTGLWLHNLPKLEPTNVVEGREERIWRMPPSKDRGKERSRFYTGIADAMADQWGSL